MDKKRANVDFAEQSFQERMTQGWKEKESLRKRTVMNVIKKNLGGERKKSESEVEGI